MPSPGPDTRGFEKYRTITATMAARVLALRDAGEVRVAAARLRTRPVNIVKAVRIVETITDARLFERRQNWRPWIPNAGNRAVWTRIENALKV